MRVILRTKKGTEHDYDEVQRVELTAGVTLVLHMHRCCIVSQVGVCLTELDSVTIEDER